MLFDAFEHFFRRHVLLQLADLVRLGRFDARVPAERVHHADETGDLVFGQQADLQIELCPLVGNFRHSILCDQHERRQEYGFDGGQHCQYDERRVEARKRQRQGVDENPCAKQDEVQVDERNASGKLRYALSEAIVAGASPLLLLALLNERTDVAFDY